MADAMGHREKEGDPTALRLVDSHTHIGMPYRVDRLELATGRVSPWKALQPDDVTGPTHVLEVALTADGEAYAYTYGRYLHDLYLFEGLRP